MCGRSVLFWEHRTGLLKSQLTRSGERWRFQTFRAEIALVDMRSNFDSRLKVPSGFVQAWTLALIQTISLKRAIEAGIA